MFLSSPATAHAAPSVDVDEEVAPLVEGQPLRLAPGSVPGTWHLAYRGRVRWAAAPQLPVVVTLSQLRGEPVARVVLERDDWFVLEADLAPGTWSVGSGHTEAWNPDDAYWQALGPMIHVATSGVAVCVSNCRGLWHALVVRPSAPAPLAMVLDPRPTLQWEVVPGAVRYELRWFEQLPSGDVLSTEQNLGVNGTSWTFPRDLPEGRKIEWDVTAIGKAGRVLGSELAHGGSSFLTRGATMPARSALPAPGTGFLGVSLIKTGLPFRAAGDEVVEVVEVLAGHAGAAAGLRPGDVIEAVDGQAVNDVEPLLQLLARHAPGTRVSLRVRRGDQALDVPVELGSRPVR